MNKTKQTAYTTRAVRWPWNKHKEQCAANSRSGHNDVRWKKHLKLSTKEKKKQEKVCMSVNTKETTRKKSKGEPSCVLSILEEMLQGSS